MSTVKAEAEKNSENEGSKPDPKKGGGLFGRLFGRGRREQDEERPAETDQIEAGAAADQDRAELKEEPPKSRESAVTAPTAVNKSETVAESADPVTEKDDSETRQKFKDSSGSAVKIPAELETEASQPVITGTEPALSPEVEATPETEPQKQKGLFSRLKNGLAKTRKQFVGTLDNLFYGEKEIDEEFLEELEEILLTSDLGVKTSYRLFAQIEEKVSHKELENPSHLRAFLQSEIGTILKGSEAAWELDNKPYVIMTIGVNGVGKTTTIGKLASIFSKQKKKVVLGAADTFRAAAVEQLTVWSERAKVPIIKQNMGADPAAVAFDTVQSAVKRNADVVIIDTAGRLHTKVNLMDELKKIQRVLGKALPGAPHEVLLVLDANTGQNAISQAQMFNQEIGVTGLVMTKLDGTAKGGVIVGVCDELKVPVRYIGIGESIADLREFDSEDFVDALFDTV